MPKTLFTTGILLIAFFLFGHAADLQAQGRLIQEVRAELEMLNRQIEIARDVLAVFPNEQGEKILQQVRELRDEAAKILTSAAPGNRQILEARQKIKSALALVESLIRRGLERPVEQLRTRLEELMRRAENEVIGSGNREAERLVHEAKKHQQLGIENLARHGLRGLEQFRIAIGLLERSLNLVHGRGRPNVDRIQRARDYFQDLESQFRDAIAVCDNPAAHRIHNQGQKQARAAEDAYLKGEYLIAQQFYNDATRLLLRAIDMCRTGIQDLPQAGERLRNQLSALTSDIAAAEKQIDPGDERGFIIIERTKRMAREAETALLKNRNDDAWRFLQRGRLLLERALRLRKRDAGSVAGQCNSILEQLQSDIRDLDEEERQSPNVEARSLIALASKSQSVAASLCEKSNTSPQSVATFRMMIRGSHQLLLQAEALLQEASEPAPERAILEQRLRQLDATIEEVRSDIEDDPTGFGKTLVDQAIQMRNQATAALKVGQLNVSMEASNVALDLLRAALKLSQ